MTNRIDMIYKKIYVKLKNNMGTNVECSEFIFDNAIVVDYGDNYLVLQDAAEHLLFKCKMSEVERFVKFN